KQGHVMAMNSLGYIYANGDGVGANMREALNWWKQSARRGLREAQDELKQRGISW
ncbi:sel1 repeat family protein, partial [Candidatus Sumerlaeota bacterium]|nr:sel1 repeat family protein [Candidatus Sumerlaeota bacterium]